MDEPKVEDKGVLDALRRKHAYIIQQFPYHARSREVLDLLIRAAVEDGLAGEENVREEMMIRFADDNIGLFLFQLEYEALANESPGKAEAYCERIRSVVPAKRVGAKAFQKELDLILERDPDAFLQKCAEVIAQATTHQLSQVALSRRAIFHHGQGRSKPAALECLRCAVLSPEKVLEHREEWLVCEILKEAGLILERDLVCSPKDSWVTKESMSILFETLGVSVDESLEESWWNSPPSSPSVTYFRLAPEFESIMNTIELEDEASFDNVLLLARLVRLGLYVLHPRNFGELNERYVANIRRYLDSGEATPERLSFLLSVHRAVCESTLDVVASDYRDFLKSQFQNSIREWFGETGNQGRPTRARAETGEGAPKISATALEEPPVQMFWQAYLDLAAAHSDNSYAQVIDRLAEIYRQINDRQAVIDYYDLFIDRFPESELAPTYLLKIARFYADDWGNPEAAAETCALVLQRYPDSPSATAAQLSRSYYLYDVGRYGEALTLLDDFITEQPDHTKACSATFLAALCEAGEGKVNEAERRLRKLVSDHPDDPVVPRALFWLGCNRLARQEYARAGEAFKDIVDCYPNSEYARSAQEYVNKLHKIAAQSPR